MEVKKVVTSAGLHYMLPPGARAIPPEGSSQEKIQRPNVAKTFKYRARALESTQIDLHICPVKPYIILALCIIWL